MKINLLNGARLGLLLLIVAGLALRKWGGLSHDTFQTTLVVAVCLIGVLSFLDWRKNKS